MSTTYDIIDLLELDPFSLKPFDIHDLLAFLGEDAEQNFDVDAIEDAVILINYDTMRTYWKPFFTDADPEVCAERLNRVAFEHRI